MSSVISKAKALFRRSSKSSITSDNGPAGIPGCSEDTGMAVASVVAQEDTQSKVEDTKVTCEPETTLAKEETRSQSVEPVESKPKNREIKVRDFAYEPFPQSKKAKKVWNPCRPLAIYDWCLLWKNELDLYLDAMDLHKLVHIGWLTAEDIRFSPSAGELLSRIPPEDIAKEYHWTHVKVQKPTTIERMICARESIFSPLFYVRYPSNKDAATKSSQEPVESHLLSDHTSLTEKTENKPLSTSTATTTPKNNENEPPSTSTSTASIVPKDVVLEEEHRGRDTNPSSSDAKESEVWPNKPRRKREESPDAVEGSDKKRIKLYGRQTHVFAPTNPANANNQPVRDSLSSSCFNAPEFVTSSSFETPLPSFKVVVNPIPSASSDSIPSDLSAISTSDLPKNSLELYRRNLERKGNRFCQFDFAMHELVSGPESSATESSSKKRRAEDTELPTSQPKRHRAIQDAIQDDMAEYASHMGNASADAGPSTSSTTLATTGDARNTKLKYIPYQANPSKKDATKSVLPRPIPSGAQPLRRHETYIGEGRPPSLSNYPFIPRHGMRRMWELLEDTPTWKFEMHGYTFEDYLPVGIPAPAKDVPSASIQEVTEDESNNNDESEAGPSKS